MIFIISRFWHSIRKDNCKTNEKVIKGNTMMKFGRKIKSANNNAPNPTVFDIERLAHKPFALSRLEAFIDGNEDIFDVLASEPKETNHS